MVAMELVLMAFVIVVVRHALVLSIMVSVSITAVTQFLVRHFPAVRKFKKIKFIQ